MPQSGATTTRLGGTWASAARMRASTTSERSLDEAADPPLDVVA